MEKVSVVHRRVRMKFRWDSRGRKRVCVQTYNSIQKVYEKKY